MDVLMVNDQSPKGIVNAIKQAALYLYDCADQLVLDCWFTEGHAPKVTLTIDPEGPTSIEVGSCEIICDTKRKPSRFSR